MIKAIKTGIILLATLLLAWLLPWCYSFVSATPTWTPFTLYSCIIHNFASINIDETRKIAGRDLNGNTYTEREFDSILPMFYYRQLAAEGRFPNEIEEIQLTPRDAERTQFFFRTSPAEINRPVPPLYRLLESMPDRVDFKAPDDVFRITKEGIEFVEMETNSVRAEKSAAFTKVLRDKGFSFPARTVSGSGSTRKEYDNGYLIVDNAYRVYHLKQMRGRPYVRQTDIPDTLGILQVFVTEFPDRKLLGFLSDKDDRFYGLGVDYTLHEIPVGGFDPTKERMNIIADMFYWTVTIKGEDSQRIVAINARDYSLVDQYIPETTADVWEQRGQYLFPFTLAFTSPLDGYVKPRFADFSLHAFWLGALLAVIYAAIYRRSLVNRIWHLAGIVLFGLFLFVPLLILEPRK